MLNGMGGLFGGLTGANARDSFTDAVLLSNYMNGCNNYHSHNGCNDCGSQYVSRYELEQSQKVAEKDSEIALLKSDKYTDQKLTDIYERLTGQIGRLEKQVYENVCTQAVTNQKLSDNITFVDNKFDNVYRDMRCGEEKMRLYVDATFVPGKLVMPLDKICPEAMPKCEPVKAQVK